MRAMAATINATWLLIPGRKLSWPSMAIVGIVFNKMVFGAMGYRQEAVVGYHRTENGMNRKWMNRIGTLPEYVWRYKLQMLKSQTIASHFPSPTLQTLNPYWYSGIQNPALESRQRQSSTYNSHQPLHNQIGGPSRLGVRPARTR